ncbi:MAG: hypothetical protein EBS53_14425, partial [Bacteroidetes bacterium]|nr:hypothetical protein [Bacteroidota bacterium]
GLKKLNKLLSTSVYGGNTMKKTIASILSSLLIAFHGSFAGIVVVSWDLAGSSTTSPNGTVTALTGLTGTSISIGSGLAVATSSSNGWGASGFDTTTTSFATALAANDYYQWSVTVGTGYALSLDGIGALSMYKSSASGSAGNFGLYYSLDNFSTAGTLAGSATVTATAAPGTDIKTIGNGWATAPISVGEGKTITFRLAGYGGTSTSSNTRFTVASTQDFSLLGTLTSLNLGTWVGGNGSWATGSGGWDFGNWVSGKDVAISGGTIAIDAAGVTAGAVNVSGTAKTTFSGGSLNAAGITKSGSSVFELANSASNSFTNGINVTEGTLKAGSSGVLNGSLTMSAGTTLDLAGTTNTAGTVSLTDTTITGGGQLNGTSFAISVGTGNINTISSTLAGNGAGLTKTGAGELVLSADNQFTGVLTVNGGTVTTSGSERIHNSVILSPGTGSTIRLGGNESVGALNTGNTSATIDLAANSLTIGYNTSSNSFSGNITGTGTVTKLGSGIQTFGTNSSWTGGFVLKDGSVRIQGNGTLDANNQMQTHALGKGTLTLEGGTIQSSTAGTDLGTTTGRSLYNSINLNGGFTSGAAGEVGRIAISTNAGGSTVLSKNSTLNTVGNLQWYQAIDGSAFTITKTGVATLELLNSNNIAGVTVQQGILGFGN